MKRIRLIVLLTLLGLLGGCSQPIVEPVDDNPAEVVLPAPAGDEAIGDIEDEAEDETIDYSDFSTAEKIYMYLREYGYMPVFSDIGQIDENWVVGTFYHYKFSAYVEKDTLSSWQYIATMQDIEEMARKYVNPGIHMDYEMDASLYGDQWNQELGGLMFSATGGSSREYDYLSLDIVEENGLFFVTCIEVRIEWDDEYVHENGTVHIGSDEVGTVLANSSGYKEYSFLVDQEELERKGFVMRENGYDETGYPNEYDYGKGYPLFIIDSKTIAAQV